MELDSYKINTNILKSPMSTQGEEDGLQIITSNFEPSQGKTRD
jgi:hypothetical protein